MEDLPPHNLPTIESPVDDTMPNLRRFYLLLPLLAFAACSPVQELRHASQKDSGDFADSLAAEYLGFSESEAEQGRELASEHFARKGLDAKSKGDVEPERPREWDMEATDERDDLQGARRRLMHIRTDFVKRVSAQSLARAQVLYDCWVLQTNAGQAGLADECRNGYLAEIRALEAAAKEEYTRKTEKLPASYTIYFHPGSAALDNDANYVIWQVTELTKKFPEYSIDVAGHSEDVSGSEEKANLSEHRAKAVTTMLIAAGLDAKRIDTAWLGKDDPAEPVVDGSSRRENRRVEIEVSPLRNAPVTESTDAKPSN